MLTPQDALFGQLVVSQRLCTPEQVSECTALLERLVESGASPLPTLGELLARKGYLTPSQAEATMRAVGRDAPERRAEEPTGERFGKYIRTRKLGEGGMGEVWKAWDTELRRWVALKFLKGEDPEEVARFRREAQTAARLAHPNIAAIYEAADDHIAMQFIDGQTLQTHPRHDPRELVSLVREAARAVHFAHQQGVVHRDLKPANLMVSEGRVYVMDFGLAKSMNLDASLTTSGMVVGTPSYMPPEQARGDLNRLDARSDVYSLGATLYEILADRPPFRRDNLYELMRDVLETDPVSVPRIDRDLDTIVMKCLEKDPARRYPDAGALADDLGRWLEGEAILAHPPSALYRFRKFLRKRRAIAIALAAIVVVAAGVWIGAREREFRSLRSQARAAAGEGRWQDALPLYERALELRRDRDLETETAHCRERSAAQKNALDLLARTDLHEVANFARTASYPELVAAVGRVRGNLEEAARLAPRLPSAHHLLGRAWHLIGRDDRAEACWRKAIEVDPAFGPAHYELGRLLLLRAFLNSLVSTHRMDRRWQDDSRAMVDEAILHLDAAGPSAFEDRLQSDLADTLRAYAKNDRELFLGRVDAGRTKYAGKPGCEEFHLLSGFAKTGDEAGGEFDAALLLRPQFALALFGRGHARFASMKWEEAIGDFEAAVRANPRFTHARLSLSFLHITRSEYREAIADADAALEVDPGFEGAWHNRGIARFHVGDLEGARKDFDRALEIAPDLIQAYADRSHVRILNGDVRGALEDGEEAVRRKPESARSWYARAVARHGAGDYDGAIEDCTRALKWSPDMAEAFAVRAACHRERGDRVPARADYDRALELNPLSAPSYVGRAYVRIAEGDAAGALADCEAAMKIAPGDWQVLACRARARHGAGDPAAALSDYAAALAVRPEEPRVLANRAQALIDLGRYEEALEDCALSLRRRPGDPHALTLQAQVWLLRGRFDDAIRNCNAALNADPRFAAAYVHRGMALQAKQDLDGAMRDYDEAVRCDPNYVQAYVNRAAVRILRQQFREAREDCEVAVRLDPRVPGAWLNLGLCRWGLGDVDGALDGIDRALRLHPGMIEAYLNRGFLHLQRQNWDAAIADLEKTLDLAPQGWPHAEQVRGALEEAKRRRP